MTAGAVGFALFLAEMFSGGFQWGIRTATYAEASMNQVERILEYTHTPSEEYRLPSLPFLLSLSVAVSPHSQSTGEGCAPSLIVAVTRRGVFQRSVVAVRVATCLSLLLMRSYHAHQSPVLHKVSFTVNPCEKVGIVGRTGAGKSSLTRVLFRLDDPFEGKVVVDGRYISQFGLNDLRPRLAIIPQGPFITVIARHGLVSRR